MMLRTLNRPRRDTDGRETEVTVPRPGTPLYTTGKRLRACEWALVVFFIYIAAISPAFRLRSGRWDQPFLVAAIAVGTLLILAWSEEHGPKAVVSRIRDWTTLALVLVAYREMDWFKPLYPDYHLEKTWIVWDRLLLHGLGLQRLIEGTHFFLPSLLELSYLLVYAIGPFTLTMLYVFNRRRLAGWVLFVYVTGTVSAYGLFPYFPSSPPRAVFPNADLPGVATLLRRVNLYLVGDYGIHSSVFPSAHVSSAFSAAFGMLIFLPDKRRTGWGMFAYAVLVSLATVYGRYHYAVDALAGFGISAVVAVAVFWAKERNLVKMTRPGVDVPRA